MAPSDSRSVNRCGHGHLACRFPINVTVPKDCPTYALIELGCYDGLHNYLSTL